MSALTARALVDGAMHPRRIPARGAVDGGAPRDWDSPAS